MSNHVKFVFRHYGRCVPNTSMVPKTPCCRWTSTYNAAAAARTLKLLERRKVTTLDIGILKRKKKPITMVTAYDYPSAVHVDLAGFDILLVGDSLGMVELVCEWVLAHQTLNVFFFC